MDYGCDSPLIIPIINDKIKLFRYETKYWHLSKAYNIAMQLATEDIILKLDCDYMLNTNFFRFNNIGPRDFMIGHGGPLMGMLMLHKKHFYAVNGYNENIINYGGDDNDIYARLKKISLNRLFTKRGTISHIPHPNILRTKYQPDPTLDKGSSTKANKKLAWQIPWTTNDKMSTLTDYDPSN